MYAQASKRNAGGETSAISHRIPIGVVIRDIRAMDFLQQLLLKAKASGRQGRASQPPAASASVAAPGAPAWRGSGKSADESLPPSVEYDFR